VGRRSVPGEGVGEVDELADGEDGHAAQVVPEAFANRFQAERVDGQRPLRVSGCLRRRLRRRWVRRRRGGVRHVAQLRGRGARAAERMEVAFPPVAETSSRMVGVLTPRL